MECGIVVMLTYMWIIISSMVMMLMKLRKLRIFKASSEINDLKDIKYFLLIEICKFNDWLKKVYPCYQIHGRMDKSCKTPIEDSYKALPKRDPLMEVK